MVDLSVVTISKNHSKGLKQTLESLQSLNQIKYEIILVIAKSFDNTQEIAEKFSRETPFACKVILQSDSGIYSAMNMGLREASGKFVIFMNSGDRFAGPDGISELIKVLSKSDNYGLAVGGYFLGDITGKKYLPGKSKLRPIQLAFTRHGGCHQSILYKTSVLRYFEGFNEHRRIVADFEVNLRIVKKFGGTRICKPISIVEPGGGGDQEIFYLHRAKHEVRREIFNSSFLNFLSIIWTLLAGAKVTYSLMKASIVKFFKFWTPKNVDKIIE
jgi:glycosyltransferase involved in cell wall biosynthesis